ncbi:MAG TPA: NAD-dependent epimerase/dehydratase family protein [Bacteroidia bacterium]|jgi:nucleoside-diphosphate-sugar epimerase|nr:NAD-dependent epimerase/dehydratase family protein [Bacteroidia bacterium]
MKDKILVIGAGGQIGKELVEELCTIYGSENIVASDIKHDIDAPCAYEKLNVLDAHSITSVIKKHNVKEVYLLAALLSATAEKYPEQGWKLNMEGLLNVLELMREKVIDKLFWPSSIAVFGPNTPKVNTPQYTVMEPSTVYGISKQAGERWCEYYFRRYGVDVRSLRYPGLISYKSPPGGGTTDYAVDIYHEALAKGRYECFLKSDTILPMMYMPDALKATIGIMQADADKVKIRSSYNLAAISFSPAEIAAEIKKHIPDFEITFKPDSRQAIADSWPQSINDTEARNHWGWKHQYTLDTMTTDILKHLGEAKK